MSNRPIYLLDERLYACANFIRKGSQIVDVGTDHAYLPIWLAKNNFIKNALALDINNKPLEIANKNIIKYNVENKVSSRLSNGLQNVYPNEANDIIIAGLGADTIINIIAPISWIRDPDKHLILQPMTGDSLLRKFLFQENFKILDEVAVKANNHTYTVMLAKFTNEKIKWDHTSLYSGKLINHMSSNACEYFAKTIRHLLNQKKSSQNTNEIEKTISELNLLIDNFKNKSEVSSQ